VVENVRYFWGDFGFLTGLTVLAINNPLSLFDLSLSLFDPGG